MRRADMRGQAMVEFALVIALVVLMVLGAVQVGLYALERNNAMSATEAGVLAAVSAESSSAGHPATGATVYKAIVPQLESALFGAHAVAQPPIGNRCPALANAWPVGDIHVCSAYDAASKTVEVCVRGWVPAMVPPGFGVSGGHAWALMLDIREVAHVATFAA